jgi:hypothetical protein
MPTIGGVNIGWDNNSPPDTESAGFGDDRIRSLKSSIQQALDAEHNFPSGGGANTGYHALGSARPYFGAQSLVSSSGSDGRLMQTSDTSRLFHVGSGGTSLIGGATVISAGSFPGGVPPQRHYWAQEFGASNTGLAAAVSVTIPNSGYSGVPFVLVSRSSTAGVNEAVTVNVALKTATTFEIRSLFASSGVSASGVAFDWLSVGSRVL